MSASESIGLGKRVLVGPTRYSELCPEGHSLLRGAGFEVLENPRLNPFTEAELSRYLPNIDAAIVGTENWTADVISRAPRVRVLGRLGVGLDNIDLKAARSNGMDVTNVPGGNANAVAELAIGLMLSLFRRIPIMDAACRAGRWDRFTGSELSCKTVGLIGFGAISQKLAHRLQGFDVRILTTDPYADSAALREGSAELVSRDELLSESDVVSLHAPHNADTHHMVNSEFLSKMQRHSVLINTSRGGLVDEAALYDSLVNNRIAGAALDVWEVEPIEPKNPLLRLESVVATTHGASDTREANKTVGLTTARAVIDVFAGRTPKNLRN